MHHFLISYTSCELFSEIGLHYNGNQFHHFLPFPRNRHLCLFIPENHILCHVRLCFIDILCCCLPCIDSCNSYTQVNGMDKWTTDWGMVSRKWLLDFVECLKISVYWKFRAITKNHHYGNFFITDGTSGCHNDNLKCYQWWQKLA